MYLVYSLLLTLGLVVLIPRFLLQALLHGKYLPGIRQRLGSLPPTPASTHPTIWLHCVSVGETQAARPFVRELRQTFPDHRLIISTVTVTGQAVARDVFKHDAQQIIYFPFDWSWSVRSALKAVKPDIVMMMETELWPNFLRQCRKTGIPVALVNGRISKRSFKGYKLVKFFVARILNGLSLALMQTESDANRIRALGMEPSKIFVTGNIKFDAIATPKSDKLKQDIEKRFRLDSQIPMLLAASTHETEEAIIIDCFNDLKKRMQAKLRLAIAPRHPERFSEVATLLEKSDLSWTRQSAAADADDTVAEAILIDTIGDLPAFYPLAAVVFVGGSLIKKGGHNVLEPALSGSAIVTGPYTDNFEAIVEALVKNDGIVQLPSATEPTGPLCDVFESILKSPNRREELGRNALRLVEANRGVASRTLKLLEPLLGQRGEETDSTMLSTNEARRS